MADADVDIAQLTEDQQLALQQFTSVTDQELAAAVPLLRKCDWNVPIAIAQFFDGDPAPIPEEPPSIPPPQTTRRQDTLANGFNSSFSRTAPSRNFEPAPRVVAQPESWMNQRVPLLASLFLTPANLLYAVFSRVFGIFSYLFPFLPRLLSRLGSRTSLSASRANTGGRTPLKPQDTTSRFLREFEEEYGTHNVPFLETGYSRAFDLAKRELKFLLVVPLSPEHDNTSTFVRGILLSPSVLTFLNNPAKNILIWAGSVQDSEAYQVSCTLNITKFPTAAVIAHTPSVSSTAMSVVGRIVAPSSPEEFLAKLQAIISEHSGALERARSSRAEQDASRNLRDQQNSAYERSLAQDRERARQRREAEAAKAREEQAAREHEERARKYERDLEQWRRWRASSLPSEPGADVKDATRISLRLLNGDRVMRKVRANADIEEVYAIAECWDILSAGNVAANPAMEPEGFTHKYEFRLVSPMPRQVFDISDGGTVGDKIGRSGNLIVERIQSDELEDAEAE